MPLIDALRSGVDLVNASNEGVINSAKAKYAYPLTQAELFKNQTENQYLPEKLRLANQHQGLINQYYGPEHQAAIDYQEIINKYQPEKSRLGNEYQGLVNADYHADKQSEINAKNAETQFVPLKYAIQAENAMRNNSRFGGSYQYLKSIADLPADQRTLYLADPANNQQYMDMIQNLHSSVSGNGGSGQGGSSLITPALLKRVGLETLSQDILGAPAPTGVVVGSEVRGGLAAPLQGMSPNGPATQTGTPPVVFNMNNGQPQVQPQQMQGGMAAPLQGMEAPQMPPQIGSSGTGPAPLSMGAPPMQSAPMPMQRAPIQAGPQPAQAASPLAQPLSAEAAKIADKHNIAPEEVGAVANDAKNPELTEKQKNLLATQMLANKKLVDAVTTKKALSGVTYEKVLGQNQDRIAPAFENAAKYAGILGRGQLTMDRFKAEHPKEYQDYMWVTQDLVPNLSNNVKAMEGLASTDNQRHALNDMYNIPLSWQSDPKMAINNINKTINLFKGQAKAALETAQPRFPGVLEKLYGLNMNDKSDYLGPGRTTEKQAADISKMSNDELLKMYKEMK